MDKWNRVTRFCILLILIEYLPKRGAVYHERIIIYYYKRMSVELWIVNCGVENLSLIHLEKNIIAVNMCVHLCKYAF